MCVLATVPSRREWYHKLLGRMVETATMELEIPIHSAAQTTLKRQLKRRGLEADESYYVAHEPLVRGREDLDIERDPPPDLAIEVDITRSSLAKLEIYAALGVPEVWSYDETLRVYEFQEDGRYAERKNSPALAFLPLQELQRFLNSARTMDETTWIRSFREWVRTLPDAGERTA